ncbi:MAG: MFS transporter [bacterium]|nr:MFS transporter [bacterium]
MLRLSAWRDFAPIPRLAIVGRALRHRNYRLFFLGQGVSLVGTWMQRVALAWLVYRLTDSAFLLGLLSFAGNLPTFLIAPLAGAIADRVDKHRLLFATQVMSMLQALLLAALVLGGWIQLWHVVALSVLMAAINGFDMPVRHALLVELVDDRRDLGNAIALNSSMFNGARLLGPSLAGLLIALAGEGVCFLANGLSYVAVLACLLMMRLPARDEARARERRRGLREGLGESWRYVMGNPPLWAILLLLMVFNFVGMTYTVLLPVFARDILGGGPDTLGFLMGGVGVGALGGAFHLASRRSVLGLGRLIVISAGIFCLALVAFALSTSVWLSLLLMLPIGFGQMIQMAGSNTLLQTLVEDEQRGRVMSFYTMSFMGSFPVGALLLGWLADVWSAPWALACGALVYAACAALALPRMPRLRQMAHAVYVRRGLLPGQECA